MLDADGANIVRTRTESRGKGEIPRVYIRRGFEREFAPPCKVSAGDGGAMLRTHSTIHAVRVRAVFDDDEAQKRKSRTFVLLSFFGDSYGNRTHVTAVKGPCLNRLTNEPGSECRI